MKKWTAIPMAAVFLFSLAACQPEANPPSATSMETSSAIPDPGSGIPPESDSPRETSSIPPVESTPPPSLPASSGPPQTDAVQKEVLFHGETVTTLYSLDYQNRLYHPYSSLQDAQAFLPSLEQLSAGQSLKTDDKVGFLVVTEKSKYAYYLDAATAVDAEKALVREAQKNNRSAAGVAQWLAYMSTSNIAKVSFSGECGPGLSLKEWPDQNSFGIKVEAGDWETIQAVSNCLKSMTMNGSPAISPFSGELNPALNTLFTLSLTFSTGVSYSIFGPTSDQPMGTLTIYSSDMAEAITYSCTDNTIKALLDCMAGLKAAEKLPGALG